MEVNKMEVFHTSGTCSRQIIFNIDENDKLTDVKFVGGCSGNLQGISKLVIGMNIDAVIEKLSGILCKSNTSCPDQLAKALKAYKRKMSESPESAAENARRR